MPTKLKIAIGCLIFHCLILTGIMIVVCQENFREGKWNLMAIGIQSGPYQFSETDYILFSLVAIPIGSFFATFTMLGSTKLCDYFKEQ